MNSIKRTVSLILTLALMISVLPAATAAQAEPFSDVPAEHYAYADVTLLRELGITDGMGDGTYGLGKSIKRSEFATFLVRLMRWELVNPAQGSFTDNQDPSQWYYDEVETAAVNGVVPAGGAFRPEDPITREEMAVMLVRTLGYDTLAQKLSGAKSFPDVTANAGYIALAVDFGITNGMDNLFKPAENARREDAAAMMVRMYRRLNEGFSELNAFYAISSYSQSDKLSSLSSASFGWSRLAYDAASGQMKLNLTRSDSNEYAVPAGAFATVSRATGAGAEAYLMVHSAGDSITHPVTGEKAGLLEYMLQNETARAQTVAAIVAALAETPTDGGAVSFNGVVVDFENLRGETLRNAFSAFLSELRAAVGSRKLMVAVQPVMAPGEAYYDGYDFRAIGNVADRIVLMAHDYYAKRLTEAEMKSGFVSTPLTPIDRIYYALKAITDGTTGVADPSKVLLQISFDSVQWKLQDGKVINSTPYHPTYDAILTRLQQSGTEKLYAEQSMNPYARFTGDDGTRSVLWYEDSRSVSAKLRLARMFGLGGVSLWRLGNIPDYVDAGDTPVYLDIWQTVLGETGR